MSTAYRRFISFVASGLALVLALASNPVPAQAAGTIVVGLPSSTCKNPAYATIQQALANAPAVNGKISVCPGTYTGPITISGKTNLKLTTKGPTIILPNANPFNGDLIKITASTNVTITGFIFNGLGHVGGTYGNSAIHVDDSSATIQKNIFLLWASSGYGLANYGIYSVNVNATSARKVKILNNTFTAFQTTGIKVYGPAALTITGNKMTTPSASATPSTGISLEGTASGKPTGTVKSNTITSDAFPAYAGGSVGVSLAEAGPLKVSANTVTHMDFGIMAVTSGVLSGGADNNSITGNKLNEVSEGISLRVAGLSGNASANHTVITGNKITNTVASTGTGIKVDAYVTGFNFANADNLVIKSNTITHCSDPVLITTSTAHVSVTGVFGPNKVKP